LRVAGSLVTCERDDLIRRALAIRFALQVLYSWCLADDKSLALSHEAAIE
jgi:hypothetical protein